MTPPPPDSGAPGKAPESAAVTSDGFLLTLFCLFKQYFIYSFCLIFSTLHDLIKKDLNTVL